MTLSFVVCVTLAFVVGLILGAVFHAWLSEKFNQAVANGISAVRKDISDLEGRLTGAKALHVTTTTNTEPIIGPLSSVSQWVTPTMVVPMPTRPPPSPPAA